MHDLPPHPRSPERVAARLLDESPPLSESLSSTALARVESASRVPLSALVLARHDAARIDATRVSLNWLVAPAVGVGLLAWFFGVHGAVAIGVAALVYAAMLVMVRGRQHRARRSDITPTLDVARQFDAVIGSSADLPEPARDVVHVIDAQLAELLPRLANATADLRDVQGAVTRHVPEALATFRAMPASARDAGAALLLSQLGTVRDRLDAALQTIASDRLQASRQFDRFLRDRASR